MGVRIPHSERRLAASAVGVVLPRPGAQPLGQRGRRHLRLHEHQEWPTISGILDENSAHGSDTIIWAKDRFVLGRAAYQRQYEPIWLGWREGAKAYWCGGRDQGD